MGLMDPERSGCSRRHFKYPPSFGFRIESGLSHGRVRDDDEGAMDLEPITSLTHEHLMS